MLATDLGDALLGSPPARQAKVIGPYAQWCVLPKARRRAVRRTYTNTSAERDRSKIDTAIACFIAWHWMPESKTDRIVAYGEHRTWLLSAAGRMGVD